MESGDLIAEGLACVRAERLVFEGVSFTVARGGLLVLRGPNGAGKSSLLRVLAGLVPLSAGAITWRDGDVTRDRAPLALALHYCGHLDAIKPALTAEENLLAWAALLGDPGPQRADQVDRALESFDLAHLAVTPGHYLSAGQRRRLGLARLLLADRPVWLLDEPTVALDAASVERFAGVVAAHRAAGGLVIAATHVDLGMGDGAVLDMAPAGVEQEPVWPLSSD